MSTSPRRIRRRMEASHLTSPHLIRTAALLFLLCCSLLVARPASAQTNALTTVSEAQIAALFASGASYTPVISQDSSLEIGGLYSHFVPPGIYQVSGCQMIQGSCYDSAGDIASAAYDLGNGLYLYAYRMQSEFCFESVWFNGVSHSVECLLSAAHLTVPLGGNALIPDGAVTSGTYWIGSLSPEQAD